MNELTEWLLEGPAWVQYRTRLDLLKQKEQTAQVVTARKAMLADPQVRNLVNELAEWPLTIITSHKSAGHPLHKLVFLADLGLRADDPGMDKIITRILEHQSPEGPFQVLMNVPKHFGGTGKNEWAWALCDAPLIAYALIRFGLGADARVRQAVNHLTNLVRDNGFPCAVSKELGKFRGPGRKDDPCPYANLVMLKTLALTEARASHASKTTVETLLSLWTQSKTQHPYMFFMGTDFRKLKTPLVWYDILHVLDTLTQFPWARHDPRLQAMAKIVNAKADAQGRFTPQSVWQAWNDWEFGQKKIPSRWLTLIAQRALGRIPA
ncbi:hypothetical protein ANRL1_03802 [Anaerolineae bacterium]|nr:hypothetical protein ANRL1_03802 [Anaerolineae bacterium]